MLPELPRAYPFPWTCGGPCISKHIQGGSCMQVHSAKRMQKVADFMALEVAQLPPLPDDPDQPRLFETWLPSKVIKAYSLRYKLRLLASVNRCCSALFLSWHNTCKKVCLASIRSCPQLLQ